MTKPQSKNNQIDAILRRILAHRGITCDDCYDVIDQYADMLRAGKDAESLLPGVKQHLTECGDCDVEFKALLIILQSVDEPDTPARTTA